MQNWGGFAALNFRGGHRESWFWRSLGTGVGESCTNCIAPGSVWSWLREETAETDEPDENLDEREPPFVGDVENAVIRQNLHLHAARDPFSR